MNALDMAILGHPGQNVSQVGHYTGGQHHFLEQTKLASFNN